MSRTPRYSGDDLEDDDNEDYEEDYEEEDFDAYVSSPKAASGVNTKDGTEKDEVVMDLAAYMKEMEKKEEQDDCQEDDAVNPAKQQSLEGFSPNPNNLNQKLFQKKFIGSDTKSQERKEGEVSFLEMIKSSTKDDAQSSPYNPSSSSDNVLENNFTLSPRNKVKINNDLVERAKARLSKQELDQPIQQLIEIRKSGSSVHSVHGEHGDGPSSDVQALLNSVNKENKEKKERTKEENEANAFRVDALLMVCYTLHTLYTLYTLYDFGTVVFDTVYQCVMYLVPNVVSNEMTMMMNYTRLMHYLYIIHYILLYIIYYSLFIISKGTLSGESGSVC